MELNKTKNRLLSIIGHDLKNPIGTQRELLKNIVENYDSLKDSGVINFASGFYIKV